MTLNNKNTLTFRLFFVLLCIQLSLTLTGYAQQKRMLLWFDKPASQPEVFSYLDSTFTTRYFVKPFGWMEALPVGNGKLGAMVFGGALNERIQLNEESLWDGGRVDAINPEAAKSLPIVQKLLFEGKADEAEILARKTMLGKPSEIKSYQSLGDLLIRFTGDTRDTSYTNFKRWLSLDSALAVTQFKWQGKTYRREVFATHPKQLIVIKMSCDKPSSLNLQVDLKRQQDAWSTRSTPDPQRIVMKGQINYLDKETGKPAGMRFESQVKIVNKGGKVSVAPNGEVQITGADEVIFYISAATNYNIDDFSNYCDDKIKNASNQDYETLFSEHLKDYQALYNRVAIELSTKGDPMELPQNKRLKRVRKRNYQDPYLSELLFQYGRYLLIASSRKGDLPANLQGLWNQTMNAPWNSDYHTNINLQMNYMGAEVVNLAECHEPLFSLMDSLSVHGAKTAKEMYGANGWVVHHLTDVFWRTAPADDLHGIWPVGQGWLSHHVFAHYLYSGDKTFLAQRAFPLMKGAAEFFLDFLKPIPSGLPFAGKLVTNPSHSPENAYETTDGKQYQFTYGATIDQEICHELFTNCLIAIDSLSTPAKPFEPEFRKHVETALNNLAPLQISKITGGLQEWIEDYKEPEIGHRHISHLYALFPSNQINVNTTELYQAARVSLKRRLMGNPNAAVDEANNRFESYNSYLNGKSFGGWLSNWVSMMWIRLGEAEEAYKHHQYQLKYGLFDNFFGGGYQLDCTFGSSAVIAEMLLQSHTGVITLLPALPKHWKNGHIKGLKAVRNFEVDITWKKHKLSTAKIISNNGGICEIKTSVPVNVYTKGKLVRVFSEDQMNIKFNTQKGQVFDIVSQ